MTEQEKQNHNQLIKEQLAHKAVLSDIQTILSTKPGKNFIKYLFQEFEIGVLPEVGFPDALLRDRLGFLRAGNSIFKIVATANPEVAGAILSQIEKEKNEQANYDDSKQGE